jgi:hypothetical protein
MTPVSAQGLDEESTHLRSYSKTAVIGLTIFAVAHYRYVRGRRQ